MRRYQLRLRAIGCSLLLVLAGSCQKPRVGDQIAVQIDQLRQQTDLDKSGENWWRKTKEKGLARLTDVETALASGHLYLSLQELRRGWVNVMTPTHLDHRKTIYDPERDSENQGVAAFQREWEKLGERLKAKQKLLVDVSEVSLPSAVKALAQVSRFLSDRHYTGGGFYGMRFRISPGLYYIGMSEPDLDFAIYCQGLEFDDGSASLTLRSMEPELAILEGALIDRNRELEDKDPEGHVPYNVVNSTLKTARELDQKGLLYGAFYKYLEAHLRFGELVRASPDTSAVAPLLEAYELAKARLSSSEIDQSIGQLYLQIGKAALDRSGLGDQNDKDLKLAAVIIDPSSIRKCNT